MRRTIKTVLLAVTAGTALFAGAMALEIGNPAANPEAMAKKAVLVTRVTACHSPEKTAVAATAEGLINGERRTVPATIVPLSTPGTYGVIRSWPEQGSWVIKVVATNPEYQNYATAVLVPQASGALRWNTAKRYFHSPSETEVAAVLHEMPVS